MTSTIRNRNVLYDGNCNICKEIVLVIDKRDKKNIFTFNTIQSPEARAVLHERNERFIDLNTIYFVDGEQIYKRSRAVFGIFTYLPPPFKTLSVFRFLPLSITDA